MIESINASHQVDHFDCGKPPLNNWLKERALSNHNYGFTSVVVAHENNNVLGYYGLSPTTVVPEILPRSVRTGQPPDPIPGILLGRFAVDLTVQGQGLGKTLLLHALRRSLEGAQLIGGRALLVAALDDQAAGYWKRGGFKATRDDAHLLFMPRGEIQKTIDSL